MKGGLSKMTTYPVAYRNGAEARELTKSRWINPEAFTQEYIPPDSDIARKTFLRENFLREFGRRWNSLDDPALEREVVKRVGRVVITKILTRSVPILGTALLVSDVATLLIPAEATVVSRPWPTDGSFPYDMSHWAASPRVDPPLPWIGNEPAVKRDDYLGHGSPSRFTSAPPGTRKDERDLDLQPLRNLGGSWVGFDLIEQLAPIERPSFASPTDRPLAVIQNWNRLDDTPLEAPVWTGPVVETIVKVRIPIGDPVPLRMPSLIPGFGKEVGHDVTDPSENDLIPKRTTQTATFVSGAPAEIGTGVHNEAPAETGVKERKVIATRAAFHLSAQLMNLVTESDDAIDAIHDALPDKYKSGWYKLHKKGGSSYYKKRREVTPQQKLRDLYNHWDEVDIHEAIENIAKNEMEDKLIGSANKRLHSAAKPWYEQSRRFVGFSTGPVL